VAQDGSGPQVRRQTGRRRLTGPDIVAPDSPPLVGVSGRGRDVVITAIVLVRAEVDRIPEVAAAIANIDGVSEVYSVTGGVDLIVMVRVRQHEDLADVIADRINKVTGIRDTQTHIAFRAYSQHDLEAAFALGFEDE
jgi:DNA-binding Lrp family transcriptional regulator